MSAYIAICIFKKLINPLHMARQPQPQHRSRHAPEPTAHFTRNRVVVIAVSLLAMLVAAALVWLLMTTLPKVDSASTLPIREVVFVGEMAHVDAGELRRVAGGIRGSMLRTDLNEVRAAIGQIHWIRGVDVRRRFPATLEVKVEEHRPFAHWQVTEGEQGFLVNTFGEVFDADFDAALPVFSGPQGSAKEVLANYSAFKSQLAVTGRSLSAVALSARRAWQIRLDNGTTLQLGRSEAGERLNRFVNAYPAVPALQLANARVDLRYQSGMAVKVATDSTARTVKKSTPKS